MSSKNLLYIVESSSDIPEDIRGDVFVIESRLGNLSEEQYRSLNSKLYDLDISAGRLPIFDICKFWLRSGTFSTEVESLPNYLFLIEMLQEEISGNGIDKIIGVDINCAIGPAIHDAASPYAVEIEIGQETSNTQDRIIDKFINILWVFPLLFDQIIASLYNTFQKDSINPNTVFVPPQTRFRSFKSVIENMNSDYAIILKRSFIMRLIKGPINPKIEQYETSLAHFYVSLSDIGTQFCYLLFDYIPREMIGNTTELDVISSIEKEFGLNLENTIPHIFNTMYKSHITNDIFKYFIYKSVLQSVSPKQIVSGIGYSPSAEAIWFAAQKTNTEAFDLPHTITLNPPKTGVFTDATFLSGEFSKKYINKNYPNRAEETKLIPKGRPYLELLTKKISEANGRSRNQIRVVIATQPYDEDTRELYVQSALNGLEQMAISSKIVIKTHPNESKENYSLYGDMNNYNIDIISGDILPEIQKSDVVISLNSNVGLEAILADCLSIVINHRKSYRHRCLPYAIEGPVPILTSASEINNFFKGLNRCKIESIKSKQQEFIKQGYVLSGATNQVTSELETNKYE